MELRLITTQEPQRSQELYKSVYDYLPDVKISDLPTEQKRKEVKNIIGMLELNYGRRFEDEKVILFIRMMSQSGYGLQRIKDCFENLIRNHPYPNFTYADLTKHNKNLYTQFDIIKSGRPYSDFIFCETPDKKAYYWDTKNGELPKVLKEIKTKKPDYVYIINPDNPKSLACWDIANYPKCPYKYVTLNELSELTPKELNAKLGHKFYDEEPNEIAINFLKNYVKRI